MVGKRREKKKEKEEVCGFLWPERETHAKREESGSPGEVPGGALQEWGKGKEPQVVLESPQLRRRKDLRTLFSRPRKAQGRGNHSTEWTRVGMGLSLPLPLLPLQLLPQLIPRLIGGPGTSSPTPLPAGLRSLPSHPQGRQQIPSGPWPHLQACGPASK